MRFRLSPPIVTAGLLVVFAIANGGAYRGFFSADDLDNLAWTSFVHAREFGLGLIDPRISPFNFRPVGHFYFFALGRMAGEQFWVYVLVLQFLHLLNSVLLFRLLRKLGLDERPALIGTLFFAFHMALFDAFWKPMYIFDVLCGTFCLASLTQWISGRWIVSLVCFWLAYKSKEVAIGLPAALALYELTLGHRRWKPLIPFMAVSLSFGIQALLIPRPDNDYTIRFTLAALGKCLAFYGNRVMLVPFGGLLLIVAVLWLRERIATWSLVSALILAGPLLFLPGRLFSTYLYVPVIALAALVAASSRRIPSTCFAVAVLAWAVLDYRLLRHSQREYLPRAAERREYVTQLRAFLQAHTDIGTVIYDSAPMEHWGVEGSVHWLSRNPVLEVRFGTEAAGFGNSARLSWDSPAKRLIVQLRAPGVSAGPTFEDGWYDREQGFRWTNGRAVALVPAMPGQRFFRLQLFMPEAQLSQSKSVRVNVTADGQPLGERVISTAGQQILIWPVSASAAPVRIQITSQPEFHAPGDPRVLGIAVVAFSLIAECKESDCL